MNNNNNNNNNNNTSTEGVEATTLWVARGISARALEIERWGKLEIREVLRHRVALSMAASAREGHRIEMLDAVAQRQGDPRGVDLGSLVDLIQPEFRDRLIWASRAMQMARLAVAHAAEVWPEGEEAADSGALRWASDCAARAASSMAACQGADPNGAAIRELRDQVDDLAHAASSPHELDWDSR